MSEETEIIQQEQIALPDLNTLYQIRAIDCIGSLFVLFVEFWDVTTTDNLILNWHIKKLCDELQASAERVIRGEIALEDVIINIPPGTSKSTLLIMLAVWLWLPGNKPDAVIISSSYSLGLSADHAQKAKDIILSERFQKYFQPQYYQKYSRYFYLVKNTEKYYRNNFGGARIATSTNGTITGKHAHIILRDDPISPEQSESPTYRLKANRFNDRTLSNRKKDKEKTPTITMMQRLHDDDTTGHELKKPTKKIRHICLPAELGKNVSPPEYRDYYVNGLLDPIRLNANVLAGQLEDLGAFGYAGQYGQSPSPEGGGKIKHDWWVYIEEEELPAGLVWDVWIDGAYTKNTDNDPTGIMICAYSDKTNRLYIYHATAEYMEMPDLLEFLPTHCDEYKVNRRSTFFIEPKASGHSLEQMINSDNKYTAVLIDSKLVSDGKEARLAVAAPRVKAGKVYLVKSNWNDKFITQIGSFPVAANDEFVDLIGYACDEYFGELGGRSGTGVKRIN